MWTTTWDALTYAGTSANPQIAAAAVSCSTVSVTGVSAGTATVTVTATDAGGLSAQESLSGRAVWSYGSWNHGRMRAVLSTAGYP